MSELQPSTSDSSTTDPITASESSTPLPSYRHSSYSSPLNPQRAARASMPALSTFLGPPNPSPALRRSSTGFMTTTSDGSSGLDSITLAVREGTVGGSFGPYPRSSSYHSDGRAPFLHRDSRASSTSLLAEQETSALFNPPYRLQSAASSSGESLHEPCAPLSVSYRPQDLLATRGVFTEQDLLWTDENKEGDDYLHDWSKADDEVHDKRLHLYYSPRGCLDAGLLVIIVTVIVGLFAGWPIYNYAIKGRFPNHMGPGVRQDIGGWNIGGINGSGQVPIIAGLPSLIDEDTPMDARTRIGYDGETYNLVFSDEFNVDGRTFWRESQAAECIAEVIADLFAAGDDPFWEAVDLHYWGTRDLEWYDPDAVTTKDGKLEITMTQEPSHGLNFRSGMLQSWNKFCFTGGFIEVSMSMPGTSKAMGYWPGAWTLGNLGRAGYGGTNHGVWPYTYNECDVGTLPNQTWPNGTDPVAAKSSGSRDYGGELSWLPGQRLSACTCPGEDHPGPNVRTGRGAPEIDINEMQVDYRGVGSTSQSIQFAPIDAGYNWGNNTPDTIIYNDSITFQNIWHGSVNQESASVTTLTDETSYDGAGYTRFGFEYDPGASGRIDWTYNDTRTWTLNAAAMGPDPAAQIGQRLVSEEPMTIILNLAISESFQPPEWGKIRFPGVLRIDFVRLYQKGRPRVTCDPASHPTADYINRHLDVYMDPNVTVWTEGNGKKWPKNRLARGGCA